MLRSYRVLRGCWYKTRQAGTQKVRDESSEEKTERRRVDSIVKLSFYVLSTGQTKDIKQKITRESSGKKRQLYKFSFTRFQYDKENTFMENNKNKLGSLLSLECKWEHLKDREIQCTKPCEKKNGNDFRYKKKKWRCGEKKLSDLQRKQEPEREVEGG